MIVLSILTALIFLLIFVKSLKYLLIDRPFNNKYYKALLYYSKYGKASFTIHPYNSMLTIVTLSYYDSKGHNLIKRDINTKIFSRDGVKMAEKDVKEELIKKYNEEMVSLKT